MVSFKTARQKVGAVVKSAHDNLRTNKQLGMLLALTAATAAVIIPETASAITAPAAGSFAYDVYNVAVNNILKGPIGFVGGMLGIIFGATQLMKSWMVGIMTILAGTVALKADTITASLGAILY